MSKTTIFSVLASKSIDVEGGLIRGVSMITVGDAKGHDLQIDATTLAQVKTASEAFTAGLQVKIDHMSGFAGIVGKLKNFVIRGKQLRADLHLLKNHDARERILEMAADMPGSFGLSIAFSGEHETLPTKIGGRPGTARFARCLEIYSADLVDSPAANPDGLFSARVADVTATPEILMLIEQRETLELALHRVSNLYSQLKGSLGLNAATVTPAIDPAGEMFSSSIVEQYAAMSAGPARLAFFQKHREALFGAQERRSA